MGNASSCARGDPFKHAIEMAKEGDASVARRCKVIDI